MRLPTLLSALCAVTGVTALQRTCDELTELARDVGALSLVTLLTRMIQTVKTGDRARAEAVAIEIEGHANRLGPALMSYVDETNPKLWTR